jgi:hypothetical protein
MQTILVTTAALVAFAWLVTGYVRRRRAGSKCDGCALARAAGIVSDDHRDDAAR